MISEIIGSLPLKQTRPDEVYSYTRFDLKIKAKKLRSGRFQVRFDAKRSDGTPVYGYLLMPSDLTLATVVSKIESRLEQIWQERAFSTGLFQLQVGATPNDTSPFLLYESR